MTFTEKAAGELKLRLRERSSARAAGAAGDRSARQRLDEALAEPRGSARQHHPRLLRRPAARAAGRGARRSAVRGAHRIAGRAALRRGVRRWLQEQLADPPEGVRRALRREPRFGGDDGPDRSAAAGRVGADAVARLHRARGRGAPFDRDGRSTRSSRSCTSSRRCTRRPRPANDPLSPARSRRGASATRSALRAGVGDDDAEPDYDGWEAAARGSVAGSHVRQRAARARTRGTATASPRDAVVAARDALKRAAGSVPAGCRRRPRGAPAAGAARRHRPLRDAESRAPARWTSSTCCSVRAIWCAATRPCARGFQARFTHIFVDEFQDTDPLQAEILLLLAADDPPRPTGARVRPSPGSCSSSAIRSSRSTASAAPTSASTASLGAAGAQGARSCS